MLCHAMCCIFPHVHTSKNPSFVIFHQNHFRFASAVEWGPLDACVLDELWEWVSEWERMCVPIRDCLSVYSQLRMRERLNAIIVCMGECVFSVPFLNTIGIVKYLEGGVFIHECCCCKEQWCENKHSQACVLFKRLRIRHEMEYVEKPGISLSTNSRHAFHFHGAHFSLFNEMSVSEFSTFGSFPIKNIHFFFLFSISNTNESGWNSPLNR